MSHSEQINELAAALAKAQGEMTGAEKNRENPHFRSNYADLASVWDACREPLSKNGLSVAQILDTEEGEVRLVTMLMHTSGQWLRSTYPVRPLKQDPQGYGSAATFARRYTLAAMVGVAPEDDDGNAASEPPRQEAAAERNGSEVSRRNCLPGPRPQPPPPSNAGDAYEGDDGPPPRTGKSLFAWAKAQEERHGAGLVAEINRFGKANSLPSKMVDWNADEVAEAHVYAVEAIRNKAAR